MNFAVIRSVALTMLSSGSIAVAGIVFFVSLCGSALARDGHVSAVSLLEQIHTQINDLDHKVESLSSAVSDAQQNNLPLVPYLEKQQSLMFRFVGVPRREQQLDAKIKQVKSLVDADDFAAAVELAQPLHKELERLLETADLIDQTIKADLRSVQTQADSKMYFKMRVRSKIPPKTLKAYGLMEIARQYREQGRFQEALALWDQTEIMIRESFNEHIAHMAEYREQLQKNAAVKRKAIRQQIQTMFEDYFISVPAGEFVMGSDSGGADERPAHRVKVNAFKIGKTEVTFELFDLCIESSGCFAVPEDEGWGRQDRPVINVSHRDIKKRFIPWLNKIMGQHYRLPTEAEWEYAARAGSDTVYSWGDTITCSNARYDGGPGSACDASEGNNIGTLPVSSFQPNAFGLYDMHGNVWEWVEDCWNENYKNAPVDGSAWREGHCRTPVLRGGAWNYNENGLRSANRYYYPFNSRKPSFGFRLVMDDE